MAGLGQGFGAWDLGFNNHASSIVHHISCFILNSDSCLLTSTIKEVWNMKIDVLGPGCPKCKKVFENAQKAVSELNLSAEVVKVEDIQEIINAGVMMTPALSIDGEIKSVGKVLSSDEIKKILSE